MKRKLDVYVLTFCIILFVVSIVQTARYHQLEYKWREFEQAKALLSDPTLRRIMCVEWNKGN